MTERFEDKVVWITGGGSGIGKALALEFARQGANVAVSGRREGRLNEVLAEIEQIGRTGLALPCDVSNSEQVKSALAEIVQKFGQLDVAVANAGIGINGPFDGTTLELWRRQMDVNVIGLVDTALCALPELRKTNGRLALIGSVMAMLPMPEFAPYTASKAAVRSIGQTLSMELHNTGVSCTTIHPGFVESEIAKVDNSGVYQESRKDPRPGALMWPADRAARVCVRAIYRRKRDYTFTGHGKFGAFVGRHFPGLVHFLLARFAPRPSQVQKGRLTEVKEGS